MNGHSLTHPEASEYVEVHNNLGCDIHMVKRSGLVMRLPGAGTKAAPVDRYLRIRHRMYHPANVAVSLPDHFGVVKETPTPMTQTYREVLENDYRAPMMFNNHRLQEIDLLFTFTLDELASAGEQGLYIKELDLVFAFTEDPDSLIHPHSPAGEVVANHDQNGPGFQYSVEIVDNDSAYDKRFIHLSGEAFQVPIVHDLERANGAYVTRPQNTQGEGFQAKLIKEHLSLEQADESIPLFKTAEQARDNGNLTAMREKAMESEIQRSKEQQLEMSVALQKARHDYEMKKKEDERVEARHRAEKAEIEKKSQLERERVKDYYESQSHKRKSTLEALKLVPSFITAATAIYFLIRQFR